MFENILLRKGFAVCAFVMAFLLTPRAWVEESASNTGVETIPVRMLDGPDDCLWCAPMQPVDCDVQPNGDAEKQPSSDPGRLWLNPDQLPPESETTPCIERPKDEPTPRA